MSDKGPRKVLTAIDTNFVDCWPVRVEFLRMDISGAVYILGQGMKLAPAAGKAAQSFMSPEIGTVPRVRADAVDCLNMLRAPEREPWTPDDLFLYFAAFTRSDVTKKRPVQQVAITWIRPQTDILDLLLRGTSDVQRAAAFPSLAAAMAEVPEMISLLGRPKDAIQTTLDVYKSVRTPVREQRIPFRTGNRLLDGLQGAAAFAMSYKKQEAFWNEVTISMMEGIQGLRDRNFRLNVLREIARCLTKAGLSSIEVKTVLLEQGLPEQDVLKTLRLG